MSIVGLMVFAGALNTGAQSNAGSIEYRNTQYGFCFSLPASWKGFSILRDQWGGYSPANPQNVTTGPLLRIRHPDWTEENPREDIPIMIFTQAQWRLIRTYKLDVSGAAPFPPSALDSNARYVFALPPRFDYDFSTGYQEVESLIRQKSLHAPCGTNAAAQ